MSLLNAAILGFIAVVFAFALGVLIVNLLWWPRPRAGEQRPLGPRKWG